MWWYDQNICSLCMWWLLTHSANINQTVSLHWRLPFLLCEKCHYNLQILVKRWPNSAMKWCLVFPNVMLCCSCDNRGVMFSGCLSKCVPILWTQSLKNASSEFISAQTSTTTQGWTDQYLLGQGWTLKLPLFTICVSFKSQLKVFFFKGMASGDHLEWCLSWTPLVMSGRGAQPGCVYLGWWVLDEAQPSSVGSVWPSARALHSLLFNPDSLCFPRDLSIHT